MLKLYNLSKKIHFHYFLFRWFDIYDWKPLVYFRDVFSDDTSEIIKLSIFMMLFRIEFYIYRVINSGYLHKKKINIIILTQELNSRLPYSKSCYY